QALSEDLKLREQQNVALAADLNQSNAALRKELEEVRSDAKEFLQVYQKEMDALKMLLQESRDKATHLSAAHQEKVEILTAQVNEEALKNWILSEDLKLQEGENVILFSELHKLNESNTVLTKQLAECADIHQKEVDTLRTLLQESRERATDFEHLSETVEILTAQVNEEALKNVALSEDLKLQEQQNVDLAADLQLLNESNTVLRKQLEGLEAQR
ncbi:hypothetical protein LDENG_00097090, partial [Lucifuga dentata]